MIQEVGPFEDVQKLLYFLFFIFNQTHLFLKKRLLGSFLDKKVSLFPFLKQTLFVLLVKLKKNGRTFIELAAFINM